MMPAQQQADAVFWRNKKVFITGHTGFKGTWLSLWLHSLGASVTGYALKPPTEPNLYDICRMDELITSYLDDIRNPDALSNALVQTAPDIVIHMAAQPLVRESYINPAATFEINMMGTVNVLEAVRTASAQGSPIRAVLNVTTDKCYDNRKWAWGYRESDRLGGSDPYSGSKACSELITDSYRRAFFHPGSAAAQVAIASARAGNVIGGGDWSKERLIPDVVRAVLRQEAVQIRYPQAVRPWQYVLEPLHGYLLLAQKLAESGSPYDQGWNFGPDDAYSVEQLVQRLCSLWGEGASYLVDKETSHPPEAHYLRLDSSMAKQELGWTPRWNLETALARTVEWYKAVQHQEDMRQVSLQQIRDYMKGVQSG
ncbi:CDP-glucose 4,6-dehydratase [Paenibacillus sp. GCM10012306]|uniref:CDP-glucose 4,6-dehydratase n=1 Tax=Paenibacillus sp. GCM10012306 TaxID=3317342 RepID=UPI0036219710